MENDHTSHNVPTLLNNNFELYFSQLRMQYLFSDEWKRVETQFKRELELHTIPNDWEQYISYLREQKNAYLQAFKRTGLVSNLWDKSFCNESSKFDAVVFLRKLHVVSDGQIDPKDLVDFFQYYCINSVIDEIIQEALMYKEKSRKETLNVFINHGNVSFGSNLNNEETLSEEEEDDVYKNLIFKVKLFDSNARILALRSIVAHAIDMGKNNAFFGDPNPYTINPYAQNEWYYIMKALEEAEIVVTHVSVAKFIDQMLDWYPWLSNEFQTVEEMVAYKRKVAKSISHEKSLWKYGSAKKVTKLKDMWAKFQQLGVNPTKVERMYNAVYQGLLLKLIKLKQEIEKQQAGL